MTIFCSGNRPNSRFVRNNPSSCTECPRLISTSKISGWLFSTISAICSTSFVLENSSISGKSDNTIARLFEKSLWSSINKTFIRTLPSHGHGNQDFRSNASACLNAHTALQKRDLLLNRGETPMLGLLAGGHIKSYAVI